MTGAGTRYQMRQRLLSIGDDYWIEDERGQPCLPRQRQGAALRQTFVLEDAQGNEVAKIQERKLSVRDKMAIERGGDSLATVQKALVGIRDRFSIDVAGGGELRAKGNFVDHEYEIDRDGRRRSRTCRSAGSGSATPTAWRSRPARTTRSSSRSRSASTRSPTRGTRRSGPSAHEPTAPSLRLRTGRPLRGPAPRRFGADRERRGAAAYSTPSSSPATPRPASSSQSTCGAVRAASSRSCSTSGLTPPLGAGPPSARSAPTRAASRPRRSASCTRRWIRAPRCSRCSSSTRGPRHSRTR